MQFLDFRFSRTSVRLPSESFLARYCNISIRGNIQFFKLAASHLAYPDIALDAFSGTDRDQVAKCFVQLLQRQYSFAVVDSPGDAEQLAKYTFRKRVLFF